jgi:hypothetical protein
VATAAVREETAGESGLLDRVAALAEELAARWTATPAELPALGPRVGFRRRFTNARAAARLIDELGAGVERVPDDEEGRAVFREAVRERLREFGASRLGWPDGYRRLLFGDAYFAASLAFARESRCFDPDLPLDELWQALRNVWIGNSLQMLLDRPVEMRPGLFAYSMLYPLTDNLLDDPGLASGSKRAFNDRFGRRLAGLAVDPHGAAEAAVFRLVDRIEAEFPRQKFPEVHQSLLAIHRGQVQSLAQQDDPTLPDDVILAISCAKGGSSVLADAYLVCGRPGPEQERFAFGYGVFLQLLDDLQDVEADLAVGHQTLFTRAAARGPLDAQAARLARFIDSVLDAHEAFRDPAFSDRKDLIRRNCRGLLVGAVAEQPKRFTRGFRRSLQNQWPLGLRAIRRLRERAERRFAQARRTLRRRTGARSLLDWALANRLDESARARQTRRPP